MATCKFCGTELEAGQKFCPFCGANIAEQNNTTNQNQNSQYGQYTQNNQYDQYTQNNQQGQYNQQGGYNNHKNGDFYSQLFNTPDYTDSFDPADIMSNTGITVCSYLSILFVVPLMGAPNSAFARFHANQGIVLFLVSFVWGCLTSILSIFTSFTGLGALIRACSNLGSLVFCAACIYGIVNVVNGRAKELPFIGKYRILK